MFHTSQVLRGGSWATSSFIVRTTYRNFQTAGDRGTFVCKGEKGGWDGMGMGLGWDGVGLWLHTVCLRKVGGRTRGVCIGATSTYTVSYLSMHLMCRILSSSSLTSQNGLLDFVHAPPKRNSRCPPHYEKKKARLHTSLIFVLACAMHVCISLRDACRNRGGVC